MIHDEPSLRYVPVHLEYILTEILKNSFRATVEHRNKHGRSGPLPPVIITISPPQSIPLGGPEKKATYLSMRIRDQGGGVQPSNLERIFSYAFTTAGRGANQDSDSDDGGPYAAQHVGGSAAISGGSGNSDSGLFGEIASKGIQTGMGTIAGLGYGLPMSRLYAKSVRNFEHLFV